MNYYEDQNTYIQEVYIVKGNKKITKEKTLPSRVFLLYFFTDYLERECFKMAGLLPPHFHPNQDLLNDGLFCTKGFGCTTGTKGFFSGKGFSGNFFCGSLASAMIIFVNNKSKSNITKWLS